MTTPNNSVAQRISRGSAAGASDARTQAAAGEARMIGNDQDTPLHEMDGVSAQRNRITPQTGGNTPAGGPPFTREP